MESLNHTKLFRPAAAAALLLLASALLAAAPAAAQDATKVAVIDVERILIESERGKAALQQIEELRDQKQAEGQTLQEEINQLQQQLQEGRLSLSEERLAELRKQAEDKMVALRRFEEDATRELTKKRDQVLAELERSVFPVINEIGEEQGFTLIFNKFNSGLVYADEAVDITAEVIERYNGGGGADAEAGEGGR